MIERKIQKAENGSWPHKSDISTVSSFVTLGYNLIWNGHFYTNFITV